MNYEEYAQKFHDPFYDEGNRREFIENKNDGINNIW